MYCCYQRAPACWYHKCCECDSPCSNHRGQHLGQPRVLHGGPGQQVDPGLGPHQLWSHQGRHQGWGGVLRLGWEKLEPFACFVALKGRPQLCGSRQQTDTSFGHVGGGSERALTIWNENVPHSLHQSKFHTGRSQSESLLSPV